MNLFLIFLSYHLLLRPFQHQSLALGGGDGDGGAMARSEDIGIGRLGVVGEGFQVAAGAVLVVAASVAVVHQHPLVGVDELEGA